ncbi:MAG: hypothetical protein WCA38_00270 [Candidatus Acidiferrales bacterium]
MVERMPNAVKSVSTDRRIDGDEELEIYARKPEKVSRFFLEDSGPSRSEAGTTAIPYSTFPPKRLRKLLQETEGEIGYLKSNFPDWQGWSRGYGPGNEPPDYYKRMRLLEKNREQIVLALSKDRKAATKTESAEAVVTLTPRRGGYKLARDPAQEHSGTFGTSVSLPETPANRKRMTRRDPEVLKRRGVVASNPDVSAREMCVIFDRKNVLLPSKWEQAVFRSWHQAYRDRKYRKRIHVLISKDRALS